jgi:hypothetical protein
MRLQSQSGLSAKAAGAALRQGALALLRQSLGAAPVKPATRDTSSTKGERS